MKKTRLEPAYCFRQSAGLPMRGGYGIELPGSSPAPWTESSQPMSFLSWESVPLCLGPSLFRVDYDGFTEKKAGRIFAVKARARYLISNYNPITLRTFIEKICEHYKFDLLVGWTLTDEPMWRIASRYCVRAFMESERKSTTLKWLSDTLAALVLPENPKKQLGPKVPKKLPKFKDAKRPSGQCQNCGRDGECSEYCMQLISRLLEYKNERNAIVHDVKLRLDKVRGDDMLFGGCERCGALPGGSCSSETCPGNVLTQINAQAPQREPLPNAPAVRRSRSRVSPALAATATFDQLIEQLRQQEFIALAS